MSKATAANTKYGFRFGPAEVTRLHAHDDGSVSVEIRSDRRSMQIRVTKTGLIRVFEVKKEKASAA